MLLDDRPRVRFWQPDTASVSGMFRVEGEDRLKTTCTEHFTVAVVYDGAFEGWYRGAAHAHVAGSLKLTEPGEVHRQERLQAPFTIQGASFAPALVAAAADAVGLRGTPSFKAATFAPGERVTTLAFAMHDALVREDASELERASLIVETLGELLCVNLSTDVRAPRAVRRARSLLREALSEKVTLDDLAEHAAVDKFHLARAFRAEVGLPPYEYLIHLRVARAKELLHRGARVAEAAQAVGFYDESQLHRHFRRIVGLSPGAYARSFDAPRRARQHHPSRTASRSANKAHDHSRSH